jgi:AcrR family transcriptional regulator
MAAIARRLGIAKPTLYRMAGSRDELIALSIDAEAERLAEAIHRDGPHGVFSFAEADPAGFMLLFGGRYPQARRVLARVERRLRMPPLTAAAFLGAAAAVALRRVEADASPTAERLRSDFDEVAKRLPAIWDSASVQGAAGRA